MAKTGRPKNEKKKSDYDPVGEALEVFSTLYRPAHEPEEIDMFYNASQIRLLLREYLGDMVDKDVSIIRMMKRGGYTSRRIGDTVYYQCATIVHAHQSYLDHE